MCVFCQILCTFNCNNANTRFPFSDFNEHAPHLWLNGHTIKTAMVLFLVRGYWFLIICALSLGPFCCCCPVLLYSLAICVVKPTERIFFLLLLYWNMRLLNPGFYSFVMFYFSSTRRFRALAHTHIKQWQYWVRTLPIDSQPNELISQLKMHGLIEAYCLNYTNHALQYSKQTVEKIGDTRQRARANQIDCNWFADHLMIASYISGDLKAISSGKSVQSIAQCGHYHDIIRMHNTISTDCSYSCNEHAYFWSWCVSW